MTPTPAITPALYRTRVAHLRRAPVLHHFEHRGYSWYIDLDDLPRLPHALRTFARFDPRDHFEPPSDAGPDTLRRRTDAVLAQNGVHLPGGRVTALLQARVLGYVFNPLSLFWCCDSEGALRAVIAEVHNTYGQRHSYVLAPDETRAVVVAKKMYVSPFNDVDGYYLVRAPRPGDGLHVTISLHRANQPAFVATLRGRRVDARAWRIARLQVTSPVAPLMGALGIRVQGIILWLRRVPVVPRDRGARFERAGRS